MRRVLIFVMLGIIMFSTFSSLIPSLPEPDSFKMLLDTVYGDISAGNFSYWTFGQKGPLIIELTSITGDADLFVGDNLRYRGCEGHEFPRGIRTPMMLSAYNGPLTAITPPSYEADKNNFSSETCGIDLVFVPGDFPRPIVIGVYGHWPHRWSQFSMKVFSDLEKLTSSRTSGGPLDERPFAGSHARMVETSRSTKDKQPLRSEITARKEDEKPRFLQFYRVLDTMFGLLV